MPLLNADEEVVLPPCPLDAPLRERIDEAAENGETIPTRNWPTEEGHQGGRKAKQKLAEANSVWWCPSPNATWAAACCSLDLIQRAIWV